MSPGIAAGLLEERRYPIYPVDAKKAGVEGTVVLEAIIGKDGAIRDLNVVSGPDLLQQAAVDAVKSWRYRPYMLNGEPVEVRTKINVDSGTLSRQDGETIDFKIVDAVTPSGATTAKVEWL